MADSITSASRSNPAGVNTPECCFTGMSVSLRKAASRLVRYTVSLRGAEYSLKYSRTRAAPRRRQYSGRSISTAATLARENVCFNCTPMPWRNTTACGVTEMRAAAHSASESVRHTARMAASCHRASSSPSISNLSSACAIGTRHKRKP